MDEIKAKAVFSIFVYIVTVLFVIVVKSMGCSLEVWECFVCSIPVLIITFFMCCFFDWV